MEVWSTGGHDVGFIQSTKAPKHRRRARRSGPPSDFRKLTLQIDQTLKDLRILPRPPFRHYRLKGYQAHVKLAELYTGRGRRRRGAGGGEGGSERPSRSRHEKKKASRPFSMGWPGNSCVAYLVMQNRNLEYGEPRFGFDMKRKSATQST